MMTIETELISKMELALSDYGKPYYTAAPSNAKLPFAVAELTSFDGNYPKNAKGIASNVYEVICYGQTPLQAQTIYQYLAVAFSEFSGSLNQHHITLARITNIFDGSEPQSSSYTRTFTLIVNYYEI